MHPHHNPIAQCVDTMRHCWQQRVTPRTTLVRWLLKPEEHKLYEGFCRLEASPHGTLEELMVLLFTPFTVEADYSRALLADWLRTYQREAEQQPVGPDWDYARFARAVAAGVPCDALLWEMMREYRTWTGQADLPLVLSLLPAQMASPAGFARWLGQVMQQPAAPQLRLLVLDHRPDNYLGPLFQALGDRATPDRAVTLTAAFDLPTAVRALAQGGNARDPQVQFRRCLFEMGQAASAKDVDRLHQWGQRAVDLGRQHQLPTLTVTACLAYAGLLFSFRDDVRIARLLADAVGLCRQQLATNPTAESNAALRPLLLQAYGYTAAHWQLQQKSVEAIGWFMTQGQQAGEFGLFGQGVSAYYRAYALATHHRQPKLATQALTMAIHFTPHLTDDEIRLSEYPYLADAYLRTLPRQPTPDARASEVVRRMREVVGEDWQRALQQQQAATQPKRINALAAAP